MFDEYLAVLQEYIDQLENSLIDFHFIVFGISSTDSSTENIKSLDKVKAKKKLQTIMNRCHEIKYIILKRTKKEDFELKLLNVLFTEKESCWNQLSKSADNLESDQDFVKVYDHLSIFRRLLFFYKSSLKYKIEWKDQGKELLYKCNRLFDILRYLAPRTIIRNSQKRNRILAKHTSELALLNRKIKEAEKLKARLRQLITTGKRIKAVEIFYTNKRKEKIAISQEYVNETFFKWLREISKPDFDYYFDHKDLSDDNFIALIKNGIPVILDFIKVYSNNTKLTRTRKLAFIYDMLIYYGVLPAEDYSMSDLEKDNYIKSFIKKPVITTLRVK